MKNIFLIFFAVSIICFSCDKVNDPYSPVTGGGGNTNATKMRKVLLEDYTGHTCGNCPEAAMTAQTIKSTYGERLVIMAVHAGFFAHPKAAPYGYDFRTNPGTEYDNFFGSSVAGNPNGLVNRVGYPKNTHIKSHGNWGSMVDGLMAQAPDAYIQISNSYSPVSRVLNTTVSTEFLNSLAGDYKLIVLLTEDSIVQAQLDYSKPSGQQNVLDYMHHYVLRAAITSTGWGEMVATGGVASGDTSVNTFSYTLPATFNGLVPDENQCYVVAFVYNASTYEVVQVEEKRIK